MWILFWYAVAAVSGGIGGCSAAAAAFLVSQKEARVAFSAAYLVLGAISAMLVFGFGAIFQFSYTSLHELIAYSLLFGASVPVTIFSQNFVAKMVLRKLGIELQVTVRKAHEDRRHGER